MVHRRAFPCAYGAVRPAPQCARGSAGQRACGCSAGQRASPPAPGTPQPPRRNQMTVTGADNISPAPAPDVAIVGAGVIGCTIAWALTKVGRRVLLVDRADPATAGASFGNVGHVATEQLQPLPSPQLLFSFWRELVSFGGALDIPLRDRKSVV